MKEVSKKVKFAFCAKVLLALLACTLFAVKCEYPSQNDHKDKKGVVGGRVLDLRGGEGQTGPGGDGGHFGIKSKTIGQFTVSPGGGKAVGAPIPLTPNPELGYNPMIVTDDSTVPVYIDWDDADLNAVEGDYFFILGETILWRCDGDGNYSPVTGVRVDRGATLTFGLNLDDGGSTGQETAEVELIYDFVNRGTVSVKSLDTGNLDGAAIEKIDGAPATDRDPGTLYIFCDNFISTGLIDVAGDNALVPGDRGGFGGNLQVVGLGGVFVAGAIDATGGDGLDSGPGGDGAGFYFPDSGVMLGSYGPVVTRGRVDVSGGNGADGGDGGLLNLISYDVAINLGDLVADGGIGLNGNGGQAGWFYYEYFGDFINTGAISLRGGDAYENGVGGPVQGGTAGELYFEGLSFENSGRIDLSGGDAFGDGNGGGGGNFLTDFYFSGITGDCIINGRIDASGGAAAGPGNSGGPGGVLFLDEIRSANIAAAIDLRGGPGDVGGTGGDFVIGDVMETTLSGYAKVVADGGAGAVGGGGGSFDLTIGDGRIEIKTRFQANGGQSFVGPGAPGGEFWASAHGGVINYSAPLSLQGSDAADGPGGKGGIAFLDAENRIVFAGAADLSGGNAGGVDNNGGAAQIFMIDCKGDASVRGSITANGGAAVGVGTGGTGGAIQIGAMDELVSRARYNALGGDGDDLVGTGGPGGHVELVCVNQPTSHLGGFNAAGGDAFNPGPDGNALIDGVIVWP